MLKSTSFCMVKTQLDQITILLDSAQYYQVEEILQTIADTIDDDTLVQAVAVIRFISSSAYTNHLRNFNQVKLVISKYVDDNTNLNSSTIFQG